MQTVVTHLIAPWFETEDPCLRGEAALRLSGGTLASVRFVQSNLRPESRAPDHNALRPRATLAPVAARSMPSGIGGSGSSKAPRWEFLPAVVRKLRQFDQREGACGYCARSVIPPPSPPASRTEHAAPGSVCRLGRLLPGNSLGDRYGPLYRPSALTSSRRVSERSRRKRVRPWPRPRRQFLLRSRVALWDGKFDRA